MHIQFFVILSTSAPCTRSFILTPVLPNHTLLLLFNQDLSGLWLDQLSLLVPSSPGWWAGRFVVEDLFNLFMYLCVDLGQDLESLDVLSDLFRLGSAELRKGLVSPSSRTEKGVNGGV